MRKFNGFLEDVAYELHIYKGDSESELSWKTRVIYSILGYMALASLRDKMEDGKPISIIHFKLRIEKLLYSYKMLYPEVWEYLLIRPTELSEEIYNIYAQTGFLYHSPNRISPAIESEAGLEEVLFIRGAQLDRPMFMSGLGTYQKNINKKQTMQDLISMFQFQPRSLSDNWNYLVSIAEWVPFEIQLRVEYLRIKPPYTLGYWKDSPDLNGQISILRVGNPGMQLYYLYHYKNKKCMVSALANWMVSQNNYRNISVCLLSAIGELPEISYHNDGEIVNIELNYLLPPAELNFLKLYSWPCDSNKLLNNFKRVIQRDIFYVFKKTIEKIGYYFREE